MTFTSQVAEKGLRYAVTAGAIAIMAFAAIALTGCGGGQADNSNNANADGEFANLDPVTLVFAATAPPNDMGDVFAHALVEHAAELTDGKLNIDYHGNGELGGVDDAYRQTLAGDIAITQGTPTTLVSFVGEAACFDLPMVFAGYDAETIDSVINGDNEFTAKLDKACEDNGFVNLGLCQVGYNREVTSNKELRTLADFKGLQIRTMESPNHLAFWKALGADPTPLAFAEVYISLQNGTIEAQENPYDTTVGASLQEVQKYLCDTHHILAVYQFVMNKDIYEGLDPAYQEALNTAVSMAIADTRAQHGATMEAAKQTIIDGDTENITYPESFYEEIKNLDGVKAIYESVSKQTNGLSDLMIEELEKTKK